MQVSEHRCTGVVVRGERVTKGCNRLFGAKDHLTAKEDLHPEPVKGPAGLHYCEQVGVCLRYRAELLQYKEEDVVVENYLPVHGGTWRSRRRARHGWDERSEKLRRWL